MIYQLLHPDLWTALGVFVFFFIAGAGWTTGSLLVMAINNLRARRGTPA